MGAGITRSLAASVWGLRYDEIPAPALEVARHALLDFIGCALAGAREPLVEILIDAVARPERATAASLIGRSERATPMTAALINGAAGHALDFDDTHTTMTGHPSVPVLPALLALAEAEAASGRRLLEALVAGVELECRLGALMGVPHYAAGFHATATLGALGAAAACAHLLAFGEEEWLHALGLAGTQAAGIRASFGTMAKPLHAGRAASNGLLAALLARRGFTSQPAIVEIAHGFAATHGAPDVAEDLLKSYAGRFLIRDTLFKYHAACYLTHAAIEAARALRADHSVDVAAIAAVEVRVAPPVLDVCNIAAPRTGLEAKFSLRATTALALRGDDTGDPATYSDERVREASLSVLRDRVRVISEPSLTPTQARVTVEMNGQRLEGEADTGIPATELSAQGERLRRKFRALAVPVLGNEQAEQLAAAARSVDDLASIEPLLRLARANGRPASPDSEGEGARDA